MKKKIIKNKVKISANENNDFSNGQNEELRGQLMRVMADYDNLEKRVEKERLVFGEVAKVRLIANLLPAIDALLGAQEHLKDQGLAIAIQTLEDTLAQNGIENIKTQTGDKFNEEYHEAVESVNDEKMENGVITNIILTGWKTSNGSIIRPVKVQVNKLN